MEQEYKENNNKNKRIFELDTLRGFAVMAMIFDHFTMLIQAIGAPYGVGSEIFSNYYKVNNSFLNKIVELSSTFQDSTFRLACHYIFVTLFLILCGISSTFSKNNFLRGIKIIGAGLIITLATVIISFVINDEFYIIFGILSTLGFSVLIYALVEKICNNKWVFLGLGIFIVIWGFLIKWWDVESIYSIKSLNFVNLIKVMLGYTLFGEDCFGLIPCAGVVLIGGFIGKTLYAKKESVIPSLNGKWTKPFIFVGRHALWFYLLHQVVAAIIIFLLFIICGYRI